MPISVTCTGVRRANGKAYVAFGKHDREFSSVAEAREFVRETLSKKVLEALLIAKWLAADPNASNPALIEGRTITGDLTINNVVRVS